jgi:hypothetical protein
MPLGSSYDAAAAADGFAVNRKRGSRVESGLSRPNRQENSMKMLIAAAAAILAAGCAHEPVQVAQAECKVMPVTTESVAGRAPRNVSPIEQRHAEMQLATSQYRFAGLRTHGMTFNNVEDALRDCRR